MSIAIARKQHLPSANQVRNMQPGTRSQWTISDAERKKLGITTKEQRALNEDIRSHKYGYLTDAQIHRDLHVDRFESDTRSSAKKSKVETASTKEKRLVHKAVAHFNEARKQLKLANEIMNLHRCDKKGSKAYKQAVAKVGRLLQGVSDDLSYVERMLDGTKDPKVRNDPRFAAMKHTLKAAWNAYDNTNDQWHEWGDIPYACDCAPGTGGPSHDGHISFDIPVELFVGGAIG
jgi:hypothetical protein